MTDAIPVAKIGDVDDGEAIVIDSGVTGTLDNIALFNDGGEYFALNDTCTHEKASLADGWIEDGVVECPLHAGKFCLKDGRVLSMPATVDAVRHEVVLDGDDILVVPAAGSLLS